MTLLLDLFLTFMKIGAFTFGGGYAMISLIDHECVEKKKWISSDEFMDMTVIAESTPGPIAINCATFAGYKVAGIKGAIAATVGVIVPSFIVILVISHFFETFLNIELVAKAFMGIRIAVAILITRAGIKMLSKMLKKKKDKMFNIIFVALFFVIVFMINMFGVHISTIYLIVIAGFLGVTINTNRDKILSSSGGMDITANNKEEIK